MQPLTPTSAAPQESINAEQAVLFSARGGPGYDFFTLKFQACDGWRYMCFGLFNESPHERNKLAAARRLYARLRRAGTVRPGSFCQLAGCNAGVYYHRQALRAKGFSIH